MSTPLCKTAVQIQYDVADCGVVFLSIVLAYYHAYINYSELKYAFNSGNEGVSLEQVVSVAQSLALHGSKKIYTEETLRQESSPVIVLMDHQHYMIYEGIKGQRVYLNDPMRGRIIFTKEDFKKHFSCVGLKLTPHHGFKKTKKKAVVWEAFKQTVDASSACYFYIAALFILSTLPAIVAANYSHVFIDYYLVKHQTNFLPPLLAGMGVFLLLQVSIEACQHFMMKKCQLIINVDINEKYLRHLFRLPYLFFASKPIGDFINIIHSNTELAFQLSSRILMSGLAFIQCLIFLLVMMTFSGVLTLIVLASILLTFAVSYWMKDILLLLHTQLRGHQGMYYAVTMCLIQLVEAINASGRQAFFFSFWLQTFSNVQRTQQRLAIYTLIVSSLTQFFIALAAIIVICLGCYLIIHRELTVGGLMGFMLLSGLLHKPIKAISTFYALLVATSVNIHRNQSVTKQLPRQAVTIKQAITDDAFQQSRRQHQGCLSIKQLHFSYSKNSPSIFQGLTIDVAAHEKIAIVGKSGCGKSTLLNILSGLIFCEQGEVNINGINLHRYSEAQRTELLNKVSKETRLVRGTFRHNLCLGDYYKAEDINHALSLAGLEKKINAYKGGLDHVISASESTLSLGYEKRLNIAMALLRNPDILLLDEPTDALDTDAEYQLVNMLCHLPCTLLMITHRMHSLDQFDKVLWMTEDGAVKLASHDQLMTDRQYQAFVTAGES